MFSMWGQFEAAKERKKRLRLRLRLRGCGIGRVGVENNRTIEQLSIRTIKQ